MDLRGIQWNGPARRVGAVLGALLGVVFAALLGGCASGSGPEDAYKALTRVDYGKPYLGMTKQEVLSCAGQPRSRIPAGKTTETLVYRYSGAGPVPSAGGDGKKKEAECSASLTFEKGTLVRVSYAHMNVRSPYAWQSEKNEKKAEEMRREGAPTCTFSLPRCPR